MNTLSLSYTDRLLLVYLKIIDAYFKTHVKYIIAMCGGNKYYLSLKEAVRRVSTVI